MEAVKNYFDEYVKFCPGAIVTERETDYLYMFRKSNLNLGPVVRKLADILLDYCLEMGSDMRRTLISTYKKDGRIVGLIIPMIVPKSHVQRLFELLKENGLDLSLSFEKYYEEFDREAEVSSIVAKINQAVNIHSPIVYPSLPHLTNLA